MFHHQYWHYHLHRHHAHSHDHDNPDYDIQVHDNTSNNEGPDHGDGADNSFILFISTTSSADNDDDDDNDDDSSVSVLDDTATTTVTTDETTATTTAKAGGRPRKVWRCALSRSLQSTVYRSTKTAATATRKKTTRTIELVIDQLSKKFRTEADTSSRETIEPDDRASD